MYLAPDGKFYVQINGSCGRSERPAPRAPVHTPAAAFPNPTPPQCTDRNILQVELGLLLLLANGLFLLGATLRLRQGLAQLQQLSLDLLLF